ncbi:MAG: shikimate kinase [bacterium]
MPNNIVLVGFMATGKSTVGRDLARQLSFDVVDTDDLIEERAEKSISDIFSEDGEEVLRDLESEIAQEVSNLTGHVIITGGGIVLREANIQALKKSGPIFCLTASPEVILQRTQGTSHRPLLQTPDPLGRIRELLQIREPFYDRSDYIVDTSAMTVLEVVEWIMDILRDSYPEILQ